jgi:hypothetical protein
MRSQSSSLAVITRQFRRYDLYPELLDAFLEWYTSAVPRIRAAHGFTVENCFLDRVGSEFSWIVSYPGTEAEFLAAEAECNGSAEFQAHFAAGPRAIREMYVSTIELVELNQ